MRAWAAALLSAFLAAPAGARAEGAPRRERLQLASEAKGLMDQRRYPEAEARLAKALEPGAARRDRGRWLPLLGRCYEDEKNFQKALTAYQDAYQVRPKDPDRMLDLARVYDAVDLNASAVDLYRKVLEKDKDRRDVLYALANVYFRSGKLPEARDAAEKYLHWEPRDLAAERLMARIEESQGDLASAAHRWEGILVEKPAADDYFYLGRLWARQNEYELADAALAKAEGLGLASSAFYFQRGLVDWYRKDNDAAARHWDFSLKKNAGNNLPAFFLALNDYRNGDTAKALERMQAVQARTGSPFVKELAARFREIAGSSKKPNG